jgi:hypothetical protein
MYIYSTNKRTRFFHIWNDKPTLPQTLCGLGFGSETRKVEEAPEGLSPCEHCFAQAEKSTVPMTPEEWDVILELLVAGEQECPWAWANGWPKAYDGEKTQEVIAKFKAFVKAEKDAA